MRSPGIVVKRETMVTSHEQQRWYTSHFKRLSVLLRATSTMASRILSQDMMAKGMDPEVLLETSRRMKPIKSTHSRSCATREGFMACGKFLYCRYHHPRSRSERGIATSLCKRSIEVSLVERRRRCVVSAGRVYVSFQTLSTSPLLSALHRFQEPRQLPFFTDLVPFID